METFRESIARRVREAVNVELDVELVNIISSNWEVGSIDEVYESYEDMAGSEAFVKVYKGYEHCIADDKRVQDRLDIVVRFRAGSDVYYVVEFANQFILNRVSLVSGLSSTCKAAQVLGGMIQISKDEFRNDKAVKADLTRKGYMLA